MAYYNSNNKKKNNYHGSHGNYKPKRSNSTGSIISAITRAKSCNVINCYEASNMIDYVTQHPYMRNCSQGIHSIINANKRCVINCYEAANQIWNLLNHS